MEVATFLMQLVLILVSARVLGELASFVKIPAVIGELIAGILIGPSLFGIIDLNTSIHFLAEIGIILLLFEVGMETDINKLSSAGLKALTVAVGGVIFPLLLSFFVSYFLFQYSLLTSLFIGCTLTATSIGITLRVLKELKKQATHESQIILAAAVLDDIFGIILLSVLYEFSSSGEINIWNIGKIILLISFFLILSPLIAKGASYLIEKWEKKTNIPGLLPAILFALILLFAWSAHSLGAPELLGGFVVGIALSEKFFSPSKTFIHKVETQVKPLVHLFTPIFFVSIGLSLNLKELEWSSLPIWNLTGTLLLAAVLGKLFSGLFLKGEGNKSKFLIGTSMIPRGEVGLIFASVGLSAGVLESKIYTSLILVITITTLIAPLVLRCFYKKNKHKTTEA